MNSGKAGKDVSSEIELFDRLRPRIRLSDACRNKGRAGEGWAHRDGVELVWRRGLWDDKGDVESDETESNDGDIFKGDGFGTAGDSGNSLT